MNYFNPTIISPIHFVSALCSSGKTYQLARYVADCSRSKGILYVSPTKKLLRHFRAELKEAGADITIIDSDTFEKTTASVCAALEECGPGRILGITFITFSNLPFFPNEGRWKVVVDEIPQVDQFLPLMVPRSNQLFLDHLNVTQLPGGR